MNLRDIVDGKFCIGAEKALAIQDIHAGGPGSGRHKGMPKFVYHGTFTELYHGIKGKEQFAIKKTGLLPVADNPLAKLLGDIEREKQYVYLADTPEATREFSMYQENPIILKVNTAKLDETKFMRDPESRQ